MAHDDGEDDSNDDDDDQLYTLSSNLQMLGRGVGILILPQKYLYTESSECPHRIVQITLRLFDPLAFLLFRYTRRYFRDSPRSD